MSSTDEVDTHKRDIGAMAKDGNGMRLRQRSNARHDPYIAMDKLAGLLLTKHPSLPATVASVSPPGLWRYIGYRVSAPLVPPAGRCYVPSLHPTAPSLSAGDVKRSGCPPSDHVLKPSRA